LIWFQLRWVMCSKLSISVRDRDTGTSVRRAYLIAALLLAALRASRLGRFAVSHSPLSGLDMRDLAATSQMAQGGEFSFDDGAAALWETRVIRGSLCSWP
jgi:hypothetical protein